MRSHSKVEIAIENVMIFNWVRSLVIWRDASDMSDIKMFRKDA